jgi:Protein of unknown function (DUF1173)
LQNRRYPISIDGQIYSVDEQLSDQFSPSRKGDKGVVEALCLCRNGQGSLNPPTVLISRRTDRQGFKFFRGVNSGPAHSAHCLFHAIPLSSSGLSVYDERAMQSTDDGAMHVQLKSRLHDIQVDFTAQRLKNGKYQCLTLKAILELVWTEAKLTRWYPGPKCDRRLGLVNAEIIACANRVFSQGKPLRSNLLVHAPAGSSLDASNRRIIQDAVADTSKLLLIAPLKTRHLDRSGQFTRLPVVGNFGLDILYLRSYVWEETCKKQTQAIELWEQGQNIIAVAVVDPRSNESGSVGQVREVALMPVSSAWIPCYTQSDIQKEEELRAAGRSFVKPLRFDAPTEMQVPDFLVAEGDGLAAVCTS